MREILFRGKTKAIAGSPYNNGKPENEWVKGYLYSDVGCWKIRQFETDYADYIPYEVDPETVGQFTGLTDKNGTKIFEGDILKRKTTPEFAKVNSFKWEHYGIVRFGYYDWDEGEAGYASVGWYIEPLKSVSIKPKNYLVGHIQAGLNQSDILNKYYPMEVIGNIHDNPELLRTPQNDEVRE